MSISGTNSGNIKKEITHAHTHTLSIQTWTLQVGHKYIKYITGLTDLVNGGSNILDGFIPEIETDHFI